MEVNNLEGNKVRVGRRGGSSSWGLYTFLEVFWVMAETSGFQWWQLFPRHCKVKPWDWKFH